MGCGKWNIRANKKPVTWSDFDPYPIHKVRVASFPLVKAVCRGLKLAAGTGLAFRLAPADIDYLIGGPLS